MFKILGRGRFSPKHLAAGDSLVLSIRDRMGEAYLAEAKIDAARAMTVDEGVLFETVFEERRALGGMVLEKKT